MGSGDYEDWAAVRQGPIRSWYALADGARVPVGSGEGLMKVVDLGDLYLPSGEVGACDPFTGLEHGNVWMRIEPGRYPVKVSLVDISENQDGSHIREAYLTLMVVPAAEEVRRAELDDGYWGGVGVDAGTVAFVDADATRRMMLAIQDDENFDAWIDIIEGSGGWFERMDDPTHLGAGLANVKLPDLEDGSNLILCHSGWGDGIYPVIAGYDENDRVVRVHIDFGVVGPPATSAAGSSSSSTQRRPEPTARMKAYALALMLVPMLIIMAIGLYLDGDAGTVVLIAMGWVFLALMISFWKGWTTW